MIWKSLQSPEPSMWTAGQLKNIVRSILMKLNHQLVSSSVLEPLLKKNDETIWNVLEIQTIKQPWINCAWPSMITTSSTCNIAFLYRLCWATITYRRSISSARLSHGELDPSNCVFSFAISSSFFICFAKLLLQSPGQYWHLIVSGNLHIWTILNLFVLEICVSAPTQMCPEERNPLQFEQGCAKRNDV